MTASPKLIIVTGKGGVGKSSVAAALAWREAKQGKRVLLAEIGEKSYYEGFFGQSISYSGTELRPRFYCALWDWNLCLKEYITHFVKFESLANLFFDNPVMKNVVRLAPGLPEISILGKATSHIRNVGPKMSIDTIILDSYATGHTLALYRAPKAIGEIISVGPLGEHSRGIYDTITNPEQTELYLVSTTEEMPITESIEFYETIKSEFNISAKIVANKWFDFPFSEEQLRNFHQQAKNLEGVKDFALYLEAIYARQEKNWQRLQNLGAQTYKAPMVIPAADKWRQTEILAGAFT